MRGRRAAGCALVALGALGIAVFAHDLYGTLAEYAGEELDADVAYHYPTSTVGGVIIGSALVASSAIVAAYGRKVVRESA